ncbi:flagellar M-ring protein FliF [Paracoccus sp. TK19116]|uniref:Flagellar M-ring protein n=1 Tax=Paracoccus albicereus TaxID=2922394 RepID=A0ABT1MRX7_9RHOB|nr:flagellar basal-body MS-ring/collar protein FliF [Paracoccus albicereus]MCQ0971048.1 flagellar M-ring protein FliF [Paracoccus albicereus]
MKRIVLIREALVLQKLQEYWGARTAQQKLVLIGAFLAAFMAISSFAWLANRPSMALLYGGLDTATAGEVVAGVERAGVAYEVRGDSIFVDAAQRDRLRLDLAAQGLPSSSTQGYELLDGMSGFGTTSQMFDAAYWRAKEGELARTILALPNIKTARVHLAVDAARGYRRETAGQASVTLTTNGQPITKEQAASLKYLVSSGVPGMSPDSVTVIDSARGVVAPGDDMTASDRASEMKRNVERIIEPHVGAGNAIVELNLDLVTEAEVMTEQRYDPQERALISEVTEETSDESSSTGTPAVTAASNLPDAEEQAGDQSQSARSENRQQQNYEVSRVTREVTRQPGSVKRLTVAVLVNGVAQTDAQGETTIVPRPDLELETIRELVASAVGFDAQRGDQITVKSLPFAALGDQGALASAPGLLERLELNGLIRVALIGLFALAVAFVVLRPVLRARSLPAPSATPPKLLDDSLPVATTAAAIIEPPQSTAGNTAALIGPGSDTGDRLALPPADPVARLREMMRERQDESMKILSTWIERKEDAL